MYSASSASLPKSVGFFDASHRQPHDNSRRVWYVDDPHIEREMIHIFEPAVGFYPLTGNSVICFPEDQTKESICSVFAEIREQNPGKRILLVLDNHFSHTCEYTRKKAHKLGIDLIFLPVGSPDLNPIEQVWKQLKWEASPLIVESAAEFRALVDDLFDRLTEKMSFAANWIEEFLGSHLQKFS